MLHDDTGDTGSAGIKLLKWSNMVFKGGNSWAKGSTIPEVVCGPLTGRPQWVIVCHSPVSMGTNLSLEAGKCGAIREG